MGPFSTDGEACPDKHRSQYRYTRGLWEYSSSGLCLRRFETRRGIESVSQTRKSRRQVDVKKTRSEITPDPRLSATAHRGGQVQNMVQAADYAPGMQGRLHEGSWKRKQEKAAGREVRRCALPRCLLVRVHGPRRTADV